MTNHLIKSLGVNMLILKPSFHFLEDIKMKKIALATICIVFSSLAFAKTINLYDQPQSTSKVVATIDTSNGVVSIYSPEKSDWMKIGDPKNGNVGWVKKSDLGDAKINFNIMTSGSNGQNYQVFQFGNSAPYSSKDATKAMQDIEAKQKVIQQEIQKSMQQLYQNAFQMWQTMPMMVPVVVVPEKAAPAKTTTTK
jgi:hypothetical protein